MIRRDAEPGHWILISQIEHARLAGMVAELWGGEACGRLEPRDELLAAIYHHDDGWAAWERRPDVDPATGRPLDFTEMPLDDSLSIWRGSILAAASLGNLPGYLVSGHFCALLRASSRWQAGTDEGRLAGAFLAEQDQSQSRWLRSWQSAAANRTERLARHALRWLQFFDRLSLWFCCAQRVGPDVLALPDGSNLRLHPLAADRVQLLPWPLLVGSLEIEAGGRSLPRDVYKDAASLAWAPARPARLRWTLVPGAECVT
jgi:hypothetical protein